MSSTPPPPPGWGGNDQPSWGTPPPPPPPPGYGPQGFGGPPGYGPQGYPPMGYAVSQATNGKATAALVCGIGSFLLCGPLLGVPAIILGRMATNEIRSSGGAQGGDGMAKAGFVLGLINVVLTTLIFLFVIVVSVLGSTTSSTTYSNVIRPLLGFGLG